MVGAAYRTREAAGKEREGDRTVFSIGDASSILRDSILSRLHRDLAETVLEPLQILPRDVEEAPGRVRCFR